MNADNWVYGVPLGGSFVDGIAAVEALPKCDAVLSGYLGSEAQGGAVLSAVKRMKEANSNADRSLSKDFGK